MLLRNKTRLTILSPRSLVARRHKPEKEKEKWAHFKLQQVKNYRKSSN
jgi:hypothetical protein